MLNICTYPSDHPLAPSTPSLLVCRYISVEREREKCVVTAGFWIRVGPISLNPMFRSERGFNSSRVHTQPLLIGNSRVGAYCHCILQMGMHSHQSQVPDSITL